MNNLLVMTIISFVITTNTSCNNNIKDSETTIVDSNMSAKKSEIFCNYFLKSDSINICLSFSKKNSKHLKFNFNFTNNDKSYKISGLADLILLEDDDGKFYTPEGTFILDESTNEEYLCDSTYAFNSENINISFGFETSSAKRLSLVIYKSKITFIKDKEYTLYKNK